MIFRNYHQNVAITEDLSMDEKSNKVKLLVYATEDDRARIKMAAAKPVSYTTSDAADE